MEIVLAQDDVAGLEFDIGTSTTEIGPRHPEAVHSVAFCFSSACLEDLFDFD